MEKRIEMCERFKDLGDVCGGKEAGILAWAVDLKIPNNKHADMVQVAIFESDAAFEQFRNTLSHQNLRNELSRLADWVDADIYVERATFFKNLT